MRTFFLVLVVISQFFYPNFSQAREEKITVGAIRWDGWGKWGETYHEERYLGPPEWRDRLPFYAKEISDTQVEVRGDTQAIMEKEIEYAAGAGLDYWAFCHYDPKNAYNWPEAGDLNKGLDLYLGSRNKDKINFCLVILSDYLPPVEEWPQKTDWLVSLFKEKTYHKVAGGRPLLFFFSVNHLEKHFGSIEKAQKALNLLCRKTEEAGLPSPFLVSQDSFDTPEGYGFDGFSAYTAPGSSEDQPSQNTYHRLMEGNRVSWESCKVKGQTIPLINTGWDYRPRLIDPDQRSVYVDSPWYEKGTPTEIAGNLRSAMDWLRKNKSTCEAKTVLIYAWNENTEGGWLIPTLYDGADRLNAIHNVLKDEP